MDEDPEVRYIRGRWQDAYGDFEQLLDYGEIRYHLLLQFNPTEPSCHESAVLQQLYDAFDAPDPDVAVEDAADKCLELLWPFMEADYTSRKREPKLPSTVRLQAVTTNSALHAVEHNLPPLGRTEPVENCFDPDLPIYDVSAIERLEEIEDQIFKVRVEGSILCLKTVHRTGYSGNLAREVSILQKCSHPNILRLVGLMKSLDEEGKIEGMLTEYIENARSLRKMDRISRDDYEKWTSQIKEAIEYLHQRDLVWGDAKAGNVLIDNDGNAILIDFGGGVTKDWVDKEHYETCEGDWQGYDRILAFMKPRVDGE